LNTTKSKSSERESLNRSGFPAFEGTRSIPKMQKTSIHVSLEEIRGETHSNPRNHTKNKGTKDKHEKDHEIHNGESSIQTRKDSQGLACRPSIHPSQQILSQQILSSSPIHSWLIYRVPPVWEMTRLPLTQLLAIQPTQGHLCNVCGSFHRTATPSPHPTSSRRKPCDPTACPPLRSFPTRPDPISVVLGLQTWF
jgi:hypothetical protein